jgi:aldehyde:ferredoxin oxidoreductase
VTFGIGADELAAMISQATGLPYSTEEFMKIGARIWNMERLFNLKAGLSAKDDTLPPRMLKDPLPAGPCKGQVSKLDQMLPEYYTLRGWDGAGVPTKKKLAELGL